MDITAKVAAEISTSLPSFGLWVTQHQAESIAAAFIELRPTTAADDLAEALLRVEGFDWNIEDEPSVRKLIMLTLIAHLDGMYYVETFEEDG